LDPADEWYGIGHAHEKTTMQTVSGIEPSKWERIYFSLILVLKVGCLTIKGDDHQRGQIYLPRALAHREWLA